MAECQSSPTTSERADTDNPRGYYEFEQIKKIKHDVSWLPETRGKAFKMVSQLLYELPSSQRYRVIFMERDMDEMLVSQDKMLARLGKPAAPAPRSREHSSRIFTSYASGSRASRTSRSCASVTTTSWNSRMGKQVESARSSGARRILGTWPRRWILPCTGTGRP